MDPYLYQYAIGSVVFAAGVVYGCRQGYLGLSGVRLRRLALLLGGLAFFMALQGYLQYAPMETAPPAPPARAESERRSTGAMGQPVDYAVMGAYLVAILAIGAWFGRKQKTTRDFFFGGQRFSWWLVAFSLVATLVGSYSFVKYSQVGYRYGLASTQTYLNDWPLMPLLLYGWIPLLYFSRITSVPEYFARRFDSRVRLAASISVLIYLVSYVGVNLYTMGTVLHHLLGWDVLAAAALVASISAVYVTLGGQTSVIMTDLFQGLMLLVAGLLLLALGVHHLGGLEAFWMHLSRLHRQAFNNFNTDPAFPSVGIFWQDAMANSAFFYFLNQGILMRFTAARSTSEARKAAVVLALVLMPVAAAVVAAGGWVGQALVHAGHLPEMDPRRAFYIAAELLARPGVFGLVLAALTAALMSTVDTLITAVAAVAVNDFYGPYVNPQATEAERLRAARVTSVAVTLLGIALVPVFAQFKTIYAAHGAMTAAVTPPLVVALFLSVFWRRFTAPAALWTIAGGFGAIALSIAVPEIIAPLAHGVPMDASFREAGEGLLAGARQYQFMRALFGLAASAAVGVGVALFTRPQSETRQRGLVWGTVRDAIRHYKGSPGEERASRRARALVRRAAADAEPVGSARLWPVRITCSLARALEAGAGDLVYVTDSRAWLGGLRSAHAVVAEVLEEEGERAVELGPAVYDLVVAPRRRRRPVVVERFY